MITDFAKKYNLPAFRINQFDQSFYQQAINDFLDLKAWPIDLREKLVSEVEFSSLSPVSVIEDKKKTTIKVVFARKNGQLLESVLMKHKDGRNTVCVSCMVGCPVGCKFCATGQMGFKGNLSSLEIIDQILFFSRQLKSTDQKVTNIVFMGMGEPLLNLKEVQNSIDIITDSKKIGIGMKRITISTSGYVPQLKQLIDSGYKGRIAISLHASNQNLREQIMPVAKVYDLNSLFNVLDYYTSKTNKRITYEYVLINDLNSSKKHAQELAGLLKNRLAHVNLIPYNIVKGVSYKTPSKTQIYQFAEYLKTLGINTTVRITFGEKIEAACGQLVKKTIELKTVNKN